MKKNTKIILAIVVVAILVGLYATGAFAISDVWPDWIGRLDGEQHGAAYDRSIWQWLSDEWPSWIGRGE